MDIEVKKILREFKKIESTNYNHDNLITEADAISSLTDINFKAVLQQYYRQLKQTVGSDCSYSYNDKSGVRATSEPNMGDYHKRGKAFDINIQGNNVTACVCKALELCATSFKDKLYCVYYPQDNEKDTPVGPHLHVAEFANLQTQTCSSGNDSLKNSDGLERDTGVTLGMFENKLPNHGTQIENLISEQLTLGNQSSYWNGTTTIPRKHNGNLYSPVDGYINNTDVPSTCTNGLNVVTSDNDFTILYCGLEKLNVKSGDRVSKGTELGTINSSDVTAVVYDRQKNKINPRKIGVVPKNKSDNSDNTEYKKATERQVEDPFLYAVFKAPFDLIKYPFKDKYDKDGKLIQKNWSSPTSSSQPSPLLKGVIDKLNPLNKSKLNEEILKIKKLLK